MSFVRTIVAVEKKTGRTGYRAVMHYQFLQPNSKPDKSSLVHPAKGSGVEPECGAVTKQHESVRYKAPVDAIAENAVAQKVEQMRGILHNAISEIRGAPLKPPNAATRSTVKAAKTT